VAHSPENSRQTLSQAAIHILVAIGTEERHGYAIMSDIAELTNGTLRIGPGTLYSTIKRLLADGLIEESGERPDPAVDDERRRYYRLTSLGREAVGREVRRLDALVAAARPWALEVRR
jgi:DNA-binding PadR family transcriptional regulator